MIQAGCPNCGERVPLLAPTCGHCGVPNAARRNLAIAAAAASALGLAAVLLAALLWSPGGRPSATDGDFVWLENAMKKCDDEATAQPDGLHFLVTPLVDEPRDEDGWRRISLNDIGNAILINSEDMLAGLRRKALRLSTEEYVFSTRDEATQEVLSWKPRSGVGKFVNENAGAITAFKVQFKSRDAALSLNWGAAFERRPGNCYWVNAILRQ